MEARYKVTAWVTSAALFWGSLSVPVLSAAGAEGREGEAGTPVRTIVGRDGLGWAVVEIRRVRGNVVVLSREVGREVDVEESVRLSLFQGRNEFNRGVPIPMLDAAVPGFREAVFLKRPDGRYAARVEFTSGGQRRYRTIPLRDRDDLLLLREYVEHFEAVRKGERRIGRKPKLPRDAEYPKELSEQVAFEMQVPRYVLSSRADGSIWLKDGSEVSGEIVPVLEGEQVVMQSQLETRRIPISEIERLRIGGNRSASALRGAAGAAMGGAVSGALAGALAGWQSDGDAGDFALFGAAFFAGAGFLVGFLRGAGQGRGGEEIRLGPVEEERGEEKEEPEG